MKIFLVAYRQWALVAAKEIRQHHPQLSIHILEDFDPDYFLSSSSALQQVFVFIGWSSLLPSTFIQKYDCFCIHPSPLPRYRGGSPIQNQIIDGKLSSAVTLFKLDSGTDTGPIYQSRPLSLEGYLPQILSRISRLSNLLISLLISDLSEGKSIPLTPQDNESATYFRRRKPSDSIVTIDQFCTMSPSDVFNHVRCLQPPYPPFQIKYPDGSVLTLNHVELS